MGELAEVREKPGVMAPSRKRDGNGTSHVERSVVDTDSDDPFND